MIMMTTTRAAAAAATRMTALLSRQMVNNMSGARASSSSTLSVVVVGGVGGGFNRNFSSSSSAAVIDDDNDDDTSLSSSAPSFMKDRSLLYRSSAKSEYELGKHRSNALDLVLKQPVIEVDSSVAVCDGGGGALGHPLEYIYLHDSINEPVACVYCGLRFIKKKK